MSIAPKHPTDGARFGVAPVEDTKAGPNSSGLDRLTHTRIILENKAKDIVRRPARARLYIERKKYRGCTVLSPEQGNDMLADTIRQGIPTAVAKIGATELRSIRHFLAHRDHAGMVQDWGRLDTRLYELSGVFPVDAVVHSRFAQTYLESIREINMLCVWFRWGERSVTKAYAPHATYLPFRALEPYRHRQPWSAALQGKRVLVVSPFAETIQAQYRQRDLVWAAKPEVLPEFELDVLRPPPYAHLVPPTDTDWFSALRRLQDEMADRDWDVALIGAGAWSLPLAAHARRLGRWGIHLGGSTQLLFGVWGARWDRETFLDGLVNEAWTRPSAQERPGRYQTIEGGCYW